MLCPERTPLPGLAGQGRFFPLPDGASALGSDRRGGGLCFRKRLRAGGAVRRGRSAAGERGKRPFSEENLWVPDIFSVNLKIFLWNLIYKLSLVCYNKVS